MPPKIIQKPSKYEESSLKGKSMKYVNYVWSFVYFLFVIAIIIAMFDEFFMNRAVVIKYLTRTALSLIVAIFAFDGVISLLDNKKAKQ